jgi:hypothetical protein
VPNRSLWVRINALSGAGRLWAGKKQETFAKRWLVWIGHGDKFIFSGVTRKLRVCELSFPKQ